MQPAQQATLALFTSACQRDERVLAAFLGGSYATSTSDAYSDLDLYLITTDEAYIAFFAERGTFLKQLGEPVLQEDFNDFGFDMILFVFSNGVEGEARTWSGRSVWPPAWWSFYIAGRQERDFN